MKPLSDLLAIKAEKKNAPRREDEAAVEAIMAALPGDNYTFARWLKLVKGKSYSEVLAIIKKAKELPSKYSRGGFITNRLKSGDMDQSVTRDKKE